MLAMLRLVSLNLINRHSRKYIVLSLTAAKKRACNAINNLLCFVVLDIRLVVAVACISLSKHKEINVVVVRTRAIDERVEGQVSTEHQKIMKDLVKRIRLTRLRVP